MNSIFNTDQDITPRSVRSKYCQCEPATLLTAVSLGVAAGGAGMSIMGQEQQNSAASQVEKQKQSAVEKQITENRRRATQDFIASVQDEQLQQSQEHESLSEQELDLGRTRRDAESKANVAAAESGVTGQSLALINQQYVFQQEQAAGRLGISQAWRDHQHRRNIDAAGRVYENRASSVQPYQQQPVKPVDYFSGVFGVAQAGIQTAIQTDAFHLGTKRNPLV